MEKIELGKGEYVIVSGQADGIPVLGISKSGVGTGLSGAFNCEDFERKLSVLILFTNQSSINAVRDHLDQIETLLTKLKPGDGK